MTVIKKELKVSTTGSAGSATGSSTLVVPFSEILAIHIEYNASVPATTDVTFKATGDPLERTFLTLSNQNTSKWTFPKVVNNTNTGASATNSHSHPVVHNGSINVSIAQCDALTDAIVVTFMLRT